MQVRAFERYPLNASTGKLFTVTTHKHKSRDIRNSK